jgi:hypothetical protein
MVKSVSRDGTNQYNPMRASSGHPTWYLSVFMLRNVMFSILPMAVSSFSKENIFSSIFARG